MDRHELRKHNERRELWAIIRFFMIALPVVTLAGLWRSADPELNALLIKYSPLIWSGLAVFFIYSIFIRGEE